MGPSDPGKTPNPFDPFAFFRQWQSFLGQSPAGAGANPFDPAGLWKTMFPDHARAFDPFQVAKTLAGSEAPGLDVAALLESHKKNLEALQNAQQVAAAGMLALIQRQGDMLREALSEALQGAQEAAKGVGPGQSRQSAKAFQKAMDKALGSLRESAEMIARSNSETFEVINRQFSEGLAEIRRFVPSNQ